MFLHERIEPATARRGSRATGSGSTRASGSGRTSSTISALLEPPPRAHRARPADRASGRRASRSWAGSRAARRPSGCRRRVRHGWSWASSAGPRSSGSTTSLPRGTPSRSLLLRWPEHGRRRRGLRRRRPERRRGVRGTRGRGHHRDRRPVALHPPRRHRRGAGDRPAARARRALRRRRARRARHRPGRGHSRLRRGLPTEAGVLPGARGPQPPVASRCSTGPARRS